MAVLMVLLLTFVIAILASYLFQQQADYRFCGRIALAMMFLFTGVSHFLLDDGMVKMLPEFVPQRYSIIYLTGLIEIAFVFGFLKQQYSRLTGIFLKSTSAQVTADGTTNTTVDANGNDFTIRNGDRAN